MTSLADMISRVYTRCGLVQANATQFWPTSVVLDAMNEELAMLGDMVSRVAPDLFKVRLTASLTRNTAYTLPSQCRHILGIRVVDGEDETRAIPKTDQSASWVEGQIDGVEQIGFDTIVLRNLDSAEVAIRYVRDGWGQLHYGACTASSTTAGPVFDTTPTLGSMILDTDYYKDLRVYIGSGTGAGQVGRISAFDKTTRAATLVSAWTTAADTTSVYSLLPPFPESMHNVLVCGAIARAPQAGWRSLMGETGELEELHQRVLDWAQRTRTEASDMIARMSQAIERDSTDEYIATFVKES